MSATAVETVTTIEGVDLEAEVPCVPDKCEHAADLLVRSTCPSCGNTNLYGICQSAWRLWAAMGAGFRCSVCSAGPFERPEIARIVEVLR